MRSPFKIRIANFLFYGDLIFSSAWIVYRRFTNVDMSETRLFLSFWYEWITIILSLVFLFLFVFIRPNTGISDKKTESQVKTKEKL